MTKHEAIKMGLDLCMERLGIDGSAAIPQLVTAIYDDLLQEKSPTLRDVNDTDLVEKRIFYSASSKRVQYVGIDTYMGVSTYKFRQLDYNNKPYYCRMDYLSRFLCQIES